MKSSWGRVREMIGIENSLSDGRVSVSLGGGCGTCQKVRYQKTKN